MRDAKLLFREKADPGAVGSEVDVGAREPGVGGTCLKVSASYDLTGATAPTGDVTCTLSGANVPGGGGTGATVAVITIPAAIAARGGAILSTTLPSRGYRYLTTTWAGLTGGFLTDGVDCGISDGSLALDADV